MSAGLPSIDGRRRPALLPTPPGARTRSSTSSAASSSPRPAGPKASPGTRPTCSETERRRAAFFIRQATAAMAPSNMLMGNPKALKALFESDGQSVQKGFAQLQDDFNTGRGRLSVTQSDPDAFDPAATSPSHPGEVVLQNPLIELIRYLPDDQDRARKPGPDLPALDQQVLRARPYARELAGRLAARPGLHCLHGLVALGRRRDEGFWLGRLSETRRPRRARLGARQAQGARQRRRLLRRRRARLDPRGAPGRRERQAHGVAYAAGRADRFLRARRSRPLHR